jgi:phosphoribosylformylglycinamidine synthase
MPHRIEPNGTINAENQLGLDIVKLFSESNSRFVCEVTPENAAKFETTLHGVPFARLGVVTEDKQLTVSSANQTVIAQSINALHTAWYKTLDF